MTSPIKLSTQIDRKRNLHTFLRWTVTFESNSLRLNCVLFVKNQTNVPKRPYIMRGVLWMEKPLQDRTYLRKISIIMFEVCIVYEIKFTISSTVCITRRSSDRNLSDRNFWLRLMCVLRFKGFFMASNYCHVSLSRVLFVISPPNYIGIQFTHLFDIKKISWEHKTINSEIR